MKPPFSSFDRRGLAALSSLVVGHCWLTMAAGAGPGRTVNADSPGEVGRTAPGAPGAVGNGVPALPAARAWEPVGLSGGGGMFTPAISPADPDLMMLNCDMSAAYLSKDGGRNWRMVHHAQLRSDTRCRPAFHPTNADVLFASSGGRLRVSRDRGRTFTPIGDLRESLSGEIAINSADPNVMLVGTGNGRCYRSRDAGGSWQACAGPNGRVIGFHFDRTRQGRTMFAATDQGVWRSDDGGETWVERTPGLPGKPIQAFAGGSDPAGGAVMLYCAVPGREVEGALRGGIHQSRDGAETWEPINAAQPLLYVKDFSVHPRDSRRILLAACDAGRGDQSGGLYLTGDGGASWRRIGRQGPQTFGGYFHPQREGWIYMTLTEGAPGAGLWLSRDHGQTWRAFDDLPFANIQRVQFDPTDDTRLHLATFGGSVWRGPIAPEAP